MENQKKGINFTIILVRALFTIFIFLVLALVLDYFKIISLGEVIKKGREAVRLDVPVIQYNKSTVLAKAGEENIYQEDLNNEIRNYPEANNKSVKKLLLDKIIKDSIILQGAQEDNIAKLDSSTFNSLNKNYTKRIELVNAVKKRIDNTSSTISGGVVSLWFYNRGPGRAGYEKGREIARETITRLREEVAKGQLTIKRAGQSIRNDPKLGYVDAGYLSNALLEFNKNPGEKITFDDKFNAIIRNLNQGEVSQIYLAKSKKWEGDTPTEEMIDSVYMFAEVTDKRSNDIKSFEDWYSQKVKKYEVTIY